MLTRYGIFTIYDSISGACPFGQILMACRGTLRFAILTGRGQSSCLKTPQILEVDCKQVFAVQAQDSCMCLINSFSLYSLVLTHAVHEGGQAGVALQDPGRNQLGGDITEECEKKGSAFSRLALFSRRSYQIVVLYHPAALQTHATPAAAQAYFEARLQYTRDCARAQLAGLQRPQKFALSFFSSCILGRFQRGTPETSARSVVAFDMDAGGASAPEGYVMAWEVSVQVPIGSRYVLHNVQVVAQVPLSWGA